MDQRPWSKFKMQVCVPSYCQQPLVQGFCHGLCVVVYVQFLVDTLDVAAHGLETDTQVPGYHLITETIDHGIKHLFFPGAKPNTIPRAGLDGKFHGNRSAQGGGKRSALPNVVQCGQ